jgi:polysaccharide deacetylase family protein (PEP-CTERM system associated)
VVVPVRNEARCIETALHQLLTQNYPPDRFEVIVSDGQSTDRTCDIVRDLQMSHGNLRLVHNTRRWSSAGRNMGVSSARGDIIVIVDGHAEVESPGYLAKLADAFARSGADCIGRPQPLDIANATSLQRAIAVARSCRLGHHPDSWIYSAGEQFVPPESVAAAYRKEVFQSVGLFDEEFDACEDVEFNHRVARAGLRCFFTPKVQARYHPRSTLRGLFQQLHRYGRGRVRLLAKHPDTLSLPCLMPAALIAAVISGAVLSLYIPTVALAYFASMGIYVLVLVLTSLALAAKARDWQLAAWLPLVFATIHFGAGVGSLHEVGRQWRRRWKSNSVSDHIRRPTENSIGPQIFPEPTENRVESVALSSTQGWRSQPHHDHGRGLLNALTIDVEDYFQVSGFEHCVSRTNWSDYESRVVGSTKRMLKILANGSVRGTFFVLGWVAEKHPDLVRAIQADGHEIGCHSYWHRLVYHQTPEEFREDLRRARAVLEDITGDAVVAYRAPSFSITRKSLWALDVLVDEGFRFDSSIYPTLHDRYGLPGAPSRPHQIIRPGGTLWEFPMAICRWFGYPIPIGGGGYFRLYPYALTRRGLEAINAAGRPFTVYLHPWEFDPDQPRLKPGRIKAFRHYVNLHRTEPRLVRLLQEFALGPLGEVYSQLQAQGELPVWDLNMGTGPRRVAA